MGADHLAGGDTISGGTGNDWIDGRAGSDWNHGQDGNDTVEGWSGDDTLRGGSGMTALSPVWAPIRSAHMKAMTYQALTTCINDGTDTIISCE